VKSRQEKLQRRAVKAGIRAAKRQQLPLGEQDLRALKVQLVGPLPRILLGTAGAMMIASAAAGWPVDSNAGQALLFFGGVILVLFALLGVRRTLDAIADQFFHEATGDFIASVAKSVADAVDV
jgi:hypothetical protein